MGSNHLTLASIWIWIWKQETRGMRSEQIWNKETKETRSGHHHHHHTRTITPPPPAARLALGVTRGEERGRDPMGRERRERERLERRREKRKREA